MDSTFITQLDSAFIMNAIEKMNQPNYWDIAYVISNCIIAIFAVIALFQLRFNKNESIQRINREKALLALEISENFVRTIITAYREAAHKIDYIYFNSDKRMVRDLTARTQKEEDFSNKIHTNKEYLKLILDLLNNLDVFSLSINNDLATEEIVFGNIGRGYCDYVATFSPFIVSVPKYQIHYSSLLKLYDKWIKKVDGA